MRIGRKTMELVRRQFVLDCNITGKQREGKVHVGRTKILPGARVHEKTDPFFRASICMGEAYIMADPSIYIWAEEYFRQNEPEWFCEFPRLRILDRILMECGREIADTHIYFLPDEDAVDAPPAGPVKWMEREEIEAFKEKNVFHNALCYSSTQPDVLAVAALADGKMSGMAGASEDGRYLWQIGVDVLPEFRGRGLAVRLVSLLRQEIERRGKIPYYGTSESHSVSRSVAVKAGFMPGFAEVYARRAQAWPGEKTGPDQAV